MVDEFDEETLSRLRAVGLTRVSFHENGKLASLDFAEAVVAAQSDVSTELDDPGTVTPFTSRTSGRLIPRAVSDR